MSNLHKFQFRLRYRNANGVHSFEGAKYRLLDSTGNILTQGLANQDGLTKTVYQNLGSRIFVELLNVATNQWESPNSESRIYGKVKKDVPVCAYTVTNCYFRVQLLNRQGRPLSWKYKIYTSITSSIKTLIASGTLDDGGMSKYIDEDTLISKHRGPESRNFHQLSNAFEAVANSERPFVDVEFYPPVGNQPIEVSFKLIPVGANKKYREHTLPLTTAVSQRWYGSIEEGLTKDSMVILKELGQHRQVILDIDIENGATYTLERRDKGKLYQDLTMTTKVTFQDGRKTEIKVPKNYQGQLLLKKGSEIIATFSLESLDPKKTNAPIIFCLSNKSTPVYKPKISLSQIINTEEMIWSFQAKEYIKEGTYTVKREYGTEDPNLIKIANTILASLEFDGVGLPSALAARDAVLDANNRRFIWDAFRKLQIGKDKTGYLKFIVKQSKTGKTLICFKGYSGLRSFLTAAKYGAQNAKVSMISSAASVASAVKATGIAGGARATVSATAKSVTSKGGLIGLALVAVFDIAEWLSADDPLNNWSDLWIGLISSLAKSVVATAAGIAAGAAIVALSTAAVPAIAVIIVGTAVTIVAGFALEWLDREFDITKRVQKYVNEEWGL